MSPDKTRPWYGSGRTPWLLAGVAAAILCIAAYANGLSAEFVMDDRAFLVDNPHLTETHDIAYFFRGDVYYYSNITIPTALYRPFFFATLWSVNSLWPGNPFAFHAFSLGLHIAATLLVLAALPRLFAGMSPLAAGIGACLFAVHPVHVEAVAWISAFIHPMATVLVLTSFLAHDRYDRSNNIVMLFLALLSFFAALLTSEIATGYPFFILALALIQRNRRGALRISVGVAPYFILLALYAGMRSAALGESVPLDLTNPDGWLRLPGFLTGYLRHLVLPAIPQPLYLAAPPEGALSALSVLTAVLLMSASLFMWLRFGQDRRGPLLAAIWIGATMAPTLAAAFAGTPLFSLRSLYLPSVGFVFFIAWILDNSGSLQRKAVIATIATCLAAATALTIAATRDWLNDRRVYNRVIASNPGHFAGYLGMARYLERSGEIRQATTYLEQAEIRAVSPKEKAGVLESLGLMLGEAGESVRSLDAYKRVLELDPDSSTAWVGVGNNLWYLGRLEDAADAYRKAHIADAGNGQACYNLVLVLKKLGRPNEAARYQACAVNLQ